MTQPQGHSTSGSHERYKSKDRLRFEIEFDPIRRMREWIISEGLADATMLDELERVARAEVERTREEAWDAYLAPIRADRDQAIAILDAAAADGGREVDAVVEELRSAEPPSRRLIASPAGSHRWPGSSSRT
jgi:TPP-dependent pyruvate/acetoin dehydrogenase alpha subunit